MHVNIIVLGKFAFWFIQGYLYTFDILVYLFWMVIWRNGRLVILFGILNLLVNELECNDLFSYYFLKLFLKTVFKNIEKCVFLENIFCVLRKLFIVIIFFVFPVFFPNRELFSKHVLMFRYSCLGRFYLVFDSSSNWRVHVTLWSGILKFATRSPPYPDHVYLDGWSSNLMGLVSIVMGLRGLKIIGGSGYR